MSQRYTPTEKAHALLLLATLYGDVTATSLQTGIPERTLRRWKNEAKNALWPQKYIDRSPDTATNARIEEFKRLRQQIMDHVFTLSASIAEDEEQAALRSLALSRLIDRVLKLDALIPEDIEPGKIRIEYAYGGSVHDVPPWANPEYAQLERDVPAEEIFAPNPEEEEPYAPYTEPPNPYDV